MATRLPASQHTREELTALIEGRLSTASAKDELVAHEDDAERTVRAGLDIIAAVARLETRAKEPLALE